ncbi:MAG: leucine-rich repeat domain-containing protein [Blautia sp.]|nr:leucine-rich repeat domain-containing protein [Blautia sp.]
MIIFKKRRNCSKKHQKNHHYPREKAVIYSDQAYIRRDGVYDFTLSDLGSNMNTGWYIIKANSNARTRTSISELNDDCEIQVGRVYSSTTSDGETLLTPDSFFTVKLYKGRTYRLRAKAETAKEEVQYSFRILPFTTNVVLTEGSCGANVRYQVKPLSADGLTFYNPNHDDTWDGYSHEMSLELVISGSEPMEDYLYLFNGTRFDDPANHNPVWILDGFMIRHIAKVTVENGVTHIGNCAFHHLENLSQLSLAGSIKSIGDNAFETCKSLTEVTIPEGVVSIGKTAFQNWPTLNGRGNPSHAIGTGTLRNTSQSACPFYISLL